MKFGVVVFPGSNCDHDCYHAVTKAAGAEAVYIWHRSCDLQGVDCVVLPGGFSYGDYLRTGAIARFSKIMDLVNEHAQEGGLVIGICNGFQILLESGLLPGAMLRNKSVKFICKYVGLKVENAVTPFSTLYKKGEIVRIPVAHGEGNYYIDKEGLKELEANNQVVFRYSGPNGEVTSKFNPNGSLNNIAGIINKKGNVLGMMPHPERCSESILGSSDGLGIFSSIIKWLKKT